MTKKYLLILISITLIGLFLRIYPFDARSWVMDFDTEVVRQALDLGKDIGQKDFSFLKKPVLYPYLTSYFLFLAYGIFYLIGSFSGLFSSVDEFVKYVFLNLNEFYWQSRLIVAIFGALTIPLVSLAVIKLFNKTKEKTIIFAALLAAWLVAFSLLHIQFSQQIRPHIVVSFFFFLSFYLYLCCLEKKNLKSFLLLGAGIGLAAGSFLSGFFAFIFLFLAGWFLNKDRNRFFGMNLIKIFYSPKFLAGLFIFLLFVIVFYPYLFFNWRTVLFEGEKFDFALSGGKHFGVENTSELLSLFGWGLGFKVILKGFLFNELSFVSLLIIFLIIYFFSRQNQPEKLIEKSGYYRTALFGWWAFSGLYFILFGLLDNGTRYRMLTPLIPFMAFGLALLFIEVYQRLGGYRRLIAIFIVVLLLFEAVQAVRLVQLMKRPYSRDEAALWIEENIPASEIIVFQNIFPNLVPNKESIEYQLSHNPDKSSLSRQSQFLLTLNEKDYPKNSKTIVDFNLLVGYNQDSVSKTYKYFKGFQPDYLVLSSRSLNIDKTKYYPEYQIAQKQGQLIKSFAPFKKSQPSRTLNFPSGLDNALIDLWAVKQLGPTVEVYKLNWR